MKPMKVTKKQIFAIALSAVMLFTMMPISVAAAETDSEKAPATEVSAVQGGETEAAEQNKNTEETSKEEEAPKDETASKDETAPILNTCRCQSKCSEENINSSCAVCKESLDKCEYKEPLANEQPVAYANTPAPYATVNGDYTTDENGIMSYKYTGGNFDVQGFFDGNWKKTSFRNGGFKTAVKIGDAFYNAAASSSAAEISNTGLKIKTEFSFTNKGQTIQVIYTVTNTSDKAVVYSLGSGADVQIGGDDKAAITPFEDGSGFKMISSFSNDYNEALGYAQFNFFGRGAKGVTDVDEFWFGAFSGDYVQQTPNAKEFNWCKGNEAIFYTGENCGTVGGSAYDSAASWSWQNRTIEQNATQTYSVLIGIGGRGSENAAAGATLDNYGSDDTTFGITIDPTDPQKKYAIQIKQGDNWVTVTDKAPTAIGGSLSGSGDGWYKNDGANGKLQFAGITPQTQVRVVEITDGLSEEPFTIKEIVTPPLKDTAFPSDSEGDKPKTTICLENDENNAYSAKAVVNNPLENYEYALFKKLKNGTNIKIYDYKQKEPGSENITFSNLDPAYDYVVYARVKSTQAFSYPTKSDTVNTCKGVILVKSHPQPADVRQGLISDSLAVEVKTIEAVTYQWYQSSTNSTTGGTAISGANSASCPIPEALTMGKYYFYCVISAVGCDETITRTAMVNVAPPFGNLSGIVKKGDTLISNGYVEIYKLNGDYIDDFELSEDGKYSFSDYEYGLYNLKVETFDGKASIVVPVNINSKYVIKDIVIPNTNGTANTKVEIDYDTPNTTADMNDLFNKPAAGEKDKGITAEDQNVLTSGGTVEIKLTAQQKAAADIKSDADKIKGFAKDSTADYLFLDLSVMKTVTPSGGTPKETKLKELNDLIEISIEVPLEYQKNTLRIFRVHEGAAEELTKTPNSFGEKFALSADNTVATLTVKRFSTFAMSANAVTPVPPAVGGGSADSAENYIITATAGAGGDISTGRFVAVPGGDSAGFTFIPHKGYQIADVLVNGKSVGAVKSYVFTNVRSNQTIHVKFKTGSHKNPNTGIVLNTGSVL